jgi:hypothetical protein
MGCYLADYRTRVGAWTGRYSWRGGSRRGDANGRSGECLGLTVLSSMVLAVLLIISADIAVYNTHVKTCESSVFF